MALLINVLDAIFFHVKKLTANVDGELMIIDTAWSHVMTTVVWRGWHH